MAGLSISNITLNGSKDGGSIAVSGGSLTARSIYEISSQTANCNQDKYIEINSISGQGYNYSLVDSNEASTTWDIAICPINLLVGATLTEVSKFGCTDVEAENYDSQAGNDDGSCEYLEEEDVYGCTDSGALNYNSNANVDDGSCEFRLDGCTDPTASNYNSEATIDDGSCVFDNESEDDLVGVSTTDPITSGYSDSGASTQLTGALTEADCTGVWIDGVGCTGGIKPMMAHGFDNVNSKLNAYFELVEEIQYKLDDTHEQLDEAKELCKDSVGSVTITNDNGETIDCTTVDGLQAYIEELELQLSTMTTDEDALAALLSTINGTVGVEDTFTSANQVGEQIAILEAEIDVLEADVAANDIAIDALNASIEELESAAAEVAEELIGYGYADIAEMNTLIVTQIATLAQLGADLAEYESTVSSLEADLDTADDLVVDLQAQLEDAMNNQEDGVSQADVDAVQALLDDANTNVADLEAQLETAMANQEDGVSQADVDAVQALLDELTNSMGVMLNDIKAVISPTVGASLSQALGELITAYSALSSDNTALVSAIDAIDAETVAALAEGEDGYNVHLVELIADIVSLQDELAEANEELSTASSESTNDNQDIANLESTIASLEDNIDVLESDILSYQSELETINTELDGVQSELGQFDELSETLGTQLNELSNYLAKYGYASTDFTVDETSSMYYETDDDNLTSVENQGLQTSVLGGSWDATQSTGYQPSFSGDSRTVGKWARFCSANGQSNSIKPLVDWGLEMRGFYKDNVNKGLNTQNMKAMNFSASGESGKLRDCGKLPNFDVINTGVNMTIFMPQITAKDLSNKMPYREEVFYAVNERGDVVGSGKNLSKAQSIAVFGKDAHMTQGKKDPLMGLHLVEEGSKDPSYGTSDYGVAEGEMISFRVYKRSGVFGIVDANGLVKTKYNTNSTFVLDGHYKLEPICDIDYVGSGSGGSGSVGGLQGLYGVEAAVEGMSTWMKAALLVGGVYLLNKFLSKKK